MSDVEVCTNFVVDVNIENFVEFPVYDYEFLLTYDSSQMTPIIAYDGDFLMEPVVFSSDLSVVGQVFCAGFTEDGGATGSGTLASVEFHCRSPGESLLNLEVIQISDEAGNMYMPDTVIPGSVVQWELPPAYVFIDPPTYTVPICTPFNVNVMVKDVVDLHSFSLQLSYSNTPVVDCLNIEDGGFLPSPTTVTHKLIDDAAGKIEFDLKSNQEFGADGSGPIARITFHCAGAGSSVLSIDQVFLYNSRGEIIERLVGPDGRVIQIGYWEPIKLIDIVEWPYPYYLGDVPIGAVTLEPEGYHEVLDLLREKGYVFDVGGNASEVTLFIEEEEFHGIVTSCWSSNTLEDGTRACMLSAEMEDGTSMAMGFVTNLLPPELTPGVDPYIIVNAQPYLFVRFYWWSWHPIGKIVSWSYWWYDSHSHPNWFWGPYWWWRTYTRSHFYPYVDVPYWRPWWGWWWHWVYWRHWHWWSTYFPYDP